MSGLAPRLGDAGRSLATAASCGGRGAWRTARRGARGVALGARGLARGRQGSASLLVVGIARLLLQVPGDAALLAFVRLVSALQTLAGVEPPGRPLDDDEHALLHAVFGGGIDARPVRVKLGRLGLLGLPRRAFVVGDHVHVPGTPGGSLAVRAPALLVHELTHVWQHQRHGTRYLSECLLAQWLGEGYNVAVAVEAGREWHELNFEQQAELFERAFAAGWFDPGRDGEARLFTQLLDRRSDDGFGVALARSGDAERMLADGWLDATPLLEAGLVAVR
jgi:hypothetical protein